MKKKTVLLLAAVLALALSGFGLSPSSVYSQAQKLMVGGEYAAAAEKLDTISGYEDATLLSMYCKAMDLGESGKYQEAVNAFQFLDTYKDSAYEAKYYAVCAQAFAPDATDEALLDAAVKFEAMAIFKDSAARAEECRSAVYDRAVAQDHEGKYADAAVIFQTLGEFKDSILQSHASCYRHAEELMNEGSYRQAVGWYQNAGDYSDAAVRAEQCLRLANFTFRSEFQITTGEKSSKLMTYQTPDVYLDDLDEDQFFRMQLVASNSAGEKVMLDSMAYRSDEQNWDWDGETTVGAEDSWRFWGTMSRYPDMLTVGEHTGTWYMDGIPVAYTSYTVHEGSSNQKKVAERSVTEVTFESYTPGDNHSKEKFSIDDLALSKLPSGDTLNVVVRVTNETDDDSIQLAAKLDGQVSSWDEYTSDGKRHGFYMGNDPLTAGDHTITIYLNSAPVYEATFTVKD